jgi:hypothetical protein
MISFMISVVPPKIDSTRLIRRTRNRAGEQRSGAPTDQGRAPSGRCEPRRSRGAIWAAITRQGFVWPRGSSPVRGVAATTTPNQRPRISQPSMRTSTHRAHRGTTATGPRDARSQPRQPGAAVLPPAAARQSGSRPESGRSPCQHEHARRSMTTAAARPLSVEWVALPAAAPSASAAHSPSRASSSTRLLTRSAPENVIYHAYSAGRGQTAQQVRRHRPGRQG